MTYIRYEHSKRLLDLLFATLAAILLFPIFVICAILVKITSTGPVFHWSSRVGKNNVLFSMPKFRSMRIETPNVATHLLENSDSYLTPIGSFLRKSSLDEIPQLYCILRGEMSFVGPRPALFSQHDLIELRTAKNIHTIPPGLTGLAQINGRDELSIESKTNLDEKYSDNRTLLLDIKIIIGTAFKTVLARDIKH